MQWKVKLVDDSEKVLKAFRRAKYVALKRLGFLIRRTAQESILNEEGPSDPGTPPHTHSKTTKSGRKVQYRVGKTAATRESHAGLLPASIVYSMDKQTESVIIGPSANVVGTVGGTLEYGGERFGREYPPRPFMEPELKGQIGDLPGLLKEEYGKIQ